MASIDSSFLDAIHGYSYFGILFRFILYETFIPLPEEIVLLTAGYFASEGVIDPILVTLVGILSFVLIDNLFYFLASRGNKFVLKFLSKIKEEKLNKYKERINKNFPRTIFILTFIPHIRLYGPILAGLSSMKWKKFFLYDTLAVSTFSILFIRIGYFFNQSLDIIKLDVIKYHTIIGYVILIILGFVSAYYLSRTLKKEE